MNYCEYPDIDVIPCDEPDGPNCTCRLIGAECGQPASVKQHGAWYCEWHFDLLPTTMGQNVLGKHLTN